MRVYRTTNNVRHIGVQLTNYHAHSGRGHCK